MAGPAADREPASSTLAGLSEAREPGAVWARRTGLALVAALVAASVAGLLGVRTTTSSASAGGYRVAVSYPLVARAGLDTTWQVRVTAQEGQGLGSRVVLAVDADYFLLFEAQAFHPEPLESTRDADALYLTFATEPGADTFVVDFDAYIQPASQRGSRGSVTVLDSGGPVVSVDYRTWLLP